MTKRTCSHCDGAMPPKRLTGPPATYCSASCRSLASYARRKDQINTARRDRHAEKLKAATRECAHCHAPFTPSKSLARIYCSDACGRAAHPADSRTHTCSEPDCDRPHRAKGLCNMHYRRVLRSQGRLKNDPWGPRRKANWKAREALARGASDAEKFPYVEIFERDGWVCGICTEPVDRDLAWPDPMSVSLDHVIPVSRDGRHSRDNAQCSHLTCNIRKSDAVQVA